MQTLKPTLTIDIWSDLVCPWCWIAKKRFEQGLNRFEFRDQVVIRHHSYRLAGGTPRCLLRMPSLKSWAVSIQRS